MVSIDEINVTKGRLMVEVMENEETEIIKLHDNRPKWGKIVKIGEPHHQDFTESQIKSWEDSEKHPFELSLGDEILLPKKEKEYSFGGKKYMIFWQSDVHIFRYNSK